MNDQNAGLGAFKQEVFGKLEGGQLKKAEILSTSIPFSEDIFEHHVWGLEVRNCILLTFFYNFWFIVDTQ